MWKRPPKRKTFEEIIGADPEQSDAEYGRMIEETLEKRDSHGQIWLVVGALLALLIHPALAFLVVIVGCIIAEPKFKP